jgi:hypothetical protein
MRLQFYIILLCSTNWCKCTVSFLLCMLQKNTLCTSNIVNIDCDWRAQCHICDWMSWIERIKNTQPKYRGRSILRNVFFFAWENVGHSKYLSHIYVIYILITNRISIQPSQGKTTFHTHWPKKEETSVIKEVKKRGHKHSHNFIIRNFLSTFLC